MVKKARTWAEISLDALSGNYKAVKAITDKRIMAVVKADAYGHGATPIARRLEEEQVDFLAVATAEEAVALHGGGVTTPLLVLGYVPPDLVAEMAERDVRLALFDFEQAKAVSGAVGRRPVKVHVKVDTGMSRLGFLSLEELEAACRLPGFVPEGIFTHLATADLPGDGFVSVQAAAFTGIIEGLRAKGLEFEIIHCANSGGVINYNEVPGNMARTGLLLYGCSPSGAGFPALTPVMRFCATVAQVKRLHRGDTVSYGRTFTVGEGASVAVLTCGYADGYHRALSNRADVLLNGCRAPIRGNICMDMMIVDATGCPNARSGDTAVLFGRDGGLTLPVDELAGRAGTISYELLCSVSARVPRFYV